MSTGRPAIVFDCDGVLVDSEKAWFVGIVDVFARRGVSELSTGPGSRLYGASVADIVEVLEREVGHPLDRDETEEEVYDAIVAAIDQGVVAMEGAVELLEAVRGSRPLAVASNGSSRTVEAAMRAAFIPQVFDAVVALEAPLRPKPAPDVYLRACALLGVPPRGAIAVEDSMPGVTSASVAGLTVVGVGPADGLGAVADLVVADLRAPELLGLLGCERLAR